MASSPLRWIPRPGAGIPTSPYRQSFASIALTPGQLRSTQVSGAGGLPIGPKDLREDHRAGPTSAVGHSRLRRHGLGSSVAEHQSDQGCRYG